MSRSDHPPIFYIFGTTCAGKDYLIERAVERYPELFGAVQVGKELSIRHPPEYFGGMGAMAKTEDEVCEIFKLQHQAAVDSGKAFILVSATPRTKRQTFELYGNYPGPVLWLHVSDETVRARLAARHNNDPASRELRLRRIETDRVILYDTLFWLHTLQAEITTIDGDQVAADTVIDTIVRTGDYAKRHFAGQ